MFSFERFLLERSGSDAYDVTHFSHVDGIKVLSPEHAGKGLDAKTRSARNMASYKDFMPRVYFGVDVGRDGGYKKEKGLGDYRYDAKIPASKVYDLDEDPLSLIAKVRKESPTRDPIQNFLNIENAIVKSGHDFYTRQHPSLGRVLVSFVPVKVTQIV